jgi:hypothetical protein
MAATRSPSTRSQRFRLAALSHHCKTKWPARWYSYLLAKLVPYARSKGSRRVFLDSVPLAPGSRKKVDQTIRDLEEQLEATREREMDKVEFQNHTATLLGPPAYPDEVQIRYREMETSLLGEGREILCKQGVGGVAPFLDRWAGWMKSIGRHRGHEVDKQILDIFSYECRAALYRCYSAVWCLLIPHLAQKYRWDEPSNRFHRLWHLEPSVPSTREIAYFHLFHGHVFALHPACGLFITTKTGGQLLGDWLKVGDAGTTFHRLLHGIVVACNFYADHHGTNSLLRKKDGIRADVEDMVALEERRAEEEYTRHAARRREEDPRS